jgi:hypothetical protein
VFDRLNGIQIVQLQVTPSRSSALLGQLQGVFQCPEVVQLIFDSYLTDQADNQSLMASTRTSDMYMSHVDMLSQTSKCMLIWRESVKL